MLPGALVMLVAGPLSGVLGTRYGSRLPLTLGAAITVLRAADDGAGARQRRA